MLSIPVTPLDAEIIRRGYHATIYYGNRVRYLARAGERPIPDTISFDEAVTVKCGDRVVARYVGDYDVVAHRDAFKIITEWMNGYADSHELSTLRWVSAAKMTYQYLDSRVREHGASRVTEPLTAFPNANICVIAAGCNAVGYYATPQALMANENVVPTNFVVSFVDRFGRQFIQVKLPGDQHEVIINPAIPNGVDNTGKSMATRSAADVRDRLALAVVTMFTVWRRYEKAGEVKGFLFAAYDELSKYTVETVDADK
jgi:hypothetical protein